MARFAFVIHPLQARDLARQVPALKYLPVGWIERIGRAAKPMIVSRITGIRSKTGATTDGMFIGCPLTPAQMVKKLPIEEVYAKIVACTELARREGAELIGLGAFTSVVGDGGVTVASRSPIAVTTGNAYTVATAIEGTRRACALLDVNVATSTLAVVGATGSIGRTCAEVLGRSFGRTILVGRDQERTQKVAEEIGAHEATTDVARIREADAVVTVSSAGAEIVLPEHLKAGAVVCDVARPRDVSVRVAKERPDVLVIEGGVVSVPGEPDFGFDFGFPERTAYACMSETMILALENDPSLFSFTLGKEVTADQVDRITVLAEKHGFGLAGFRSFEREVDDAAIARARAARHLAPAIPRAA